MATEPRTPIHLRENKGVGELARRAGVSVSTASQKLKRGKTPEQIIEEAATWRQQQAEKQAREGVRAKAPESSNGVDGGESYSEAQRRKEVALANLRELELNVKSGDLTPVSEINAWVAGMIIEARNILLRIAPELRDRLAIETDPAEIDKLISAEIDRALYQLKSFR